MMTILSQTLLDILDELNDSSSHIQASAIISIDGLVMAALIENTVDEDRVGALTTAISDQAGRVAQEMKLGSLQQVLIKAEQGLVLVRRAGEQAVLIVIMEKAAQLGFIFLKCRQSADKIVASGIVKPSPRLGLVYLGRRKDN